MQLNFKTLKKKKKKSLPEASPAAKRMPHILATALGNPPSPARSLPRVSRPLPPGIPTPLRAVETCGGLSLSRSRYWTLNHTPSLNCLMVEFSASGVQFRIKIPGPCLPKTSVIYLFSIQHPDSRILGFSRVPRIIYLYLPTGSCHIMRANYVPGAACTVSSFNPQHTSEIPDSQMSPRKVK